MLLRRCVSQQTWGKGRALLEALGLTTAQIAECYGMHSLNEEESVQHGLQVWLEGGTNTTWEALLEAMETAEIDIQQREGLKEEIHTNTATLDEEVPAGTTQGKSFRAKLGRYYNKACIQDNPILASPAMQYVKLNLVQPEQWRPVEGRVEEAVAVHLAKGGVQQVPHEKVPLEYQDILAFTPPAGSFRQRVLIEGVAGSGKSTLTQLMCCDYSNGGFAQDYNIVIPVALRSLPKDQQKLILQDLIFTSVGDADVVEEVAASITSCHGQAVLFIFDGFDELSEEMRKSSLVRDIIKGRILPQSSFVVTTRPISAESLYHCMDRRVELSGFGKEEVKKYVTEYFASSNPSAGKKLLSTLSLRPHIERLCYVPLLLLMVCYIVTLDGDSAELPRTLHQLFEYLIILTLNHNLERTGRNERAGTLQDVNRLCSSFDKLTQLALEGILKDTIIFSNLDFEVDSAFLGLFNCIVTRNRFGVVSHTWHFLHLAVQEYMAALAVAKKTPEEQVTFWKQHLTLKYNKRGEFVLTQDRYHTLFLFYSGLTGLGIPGIQRMLLDTLNTIVEPHISESTPLPELIAVVAESGNVQLARSILSPCGPTVEIDGGYLENADVAWCVSEYCKQVDGAGIRIGEGYDTTSSVSNFISQLGDISTLSKVELLQFDHLTGFGYADVSGMRTVRQFLLKQTQLKCVMFRGLDNIKKDAIDAVKDVLTHHKESLEEVTLHGRIGGGAPLDPLVDSLVACQRLTSLELARFTLSCQSLVAVVKGLHNLRALGLGEVSLSDDRSLTTSDVHLITSSVEHHPSLRELTVKGECSGSLVKGAVEGMAWRNDVEKLVVTPYWEGIALGMVPPICAVMRAGSLKTLDIGELSKPDQVVQVLEELPHCTHLSELKLDLSWSDEGVILPAAVKAGLSKCTTLQKLTVRRSPPSVTAPFLKAVTMIRSLEEVTLYKCDYGDVDEEVVGFLSHLKEVKQLRKVVMTKCRNLSPFLIATICEGLCSRNSMEDVVVALSVRRELEGEDVTDPDVLKAVEAAVRRSLSVKRIKIKGKYLRWTNVATAILKGAAQSKPLKEVELQTPKDSPPPQEVVDDVRKANPKLRLVVRARYESQLVSSLEELSVSPLKTEVSSLQAGRGSDPPEREDASNLLTDEAALKSLCWIPFGIKTISIEAKGGILCLEPTSDDLQVTKEDTIFVEVPPDAVSTFADVKMHYAIIPSGTFTLSEGYQFGSPVVYIYYDGQQVTKPLALHLPHWYGGEDRARDGLSFAVAPHSLKGRSMYHFQLLAGGKFPVNSHYGVIEIDGHCSLFTTVLENGATVNCQAFSLIKDSEDETECKAECNIAVTNAVYCWRRILIDNRPGWDVSPPTLFQFKSDRITATLKEKSHVHGDWRAYFTGASELLSSHVQYDALGIHSEQALEDAVKDYAYPPAIRYMVKYRKELRRMGRSTEVTMQLHISDTDQPMDFPYTAYERIQDHIETGATCQPNMSSTPAADHGIPNPKRKWPNPTGKVPTAPC